MTTGTNRKNWQEHKKKVFGSVFRPTKHIKEDSLRGCEKKEHPCSQIHPCGSRLPTILRKKSHVTIELAKHCSESDE